MALLGHLTSLPTPDIEQKAAFPVGTSRFIIYGQWIVFQLRKEPQEVLTF